jgi:hypothetical protein
LASASNRARPDRTRDIPSRTSRLHNRNIVFHWAAIKRPEQP